MIVLAGDRAAWPLGMLPVRSRHPPPPVGDVVQRDRAVGRREDQRAGHELLVGRLGRSRRHLRFELIPVHRPLGRRDIAGGIDEPAELGVGHFGPIDPETIDLAPDAPAARRDRPGHHPCPSGTRRPESRPCPAELHRARVASGPVGQASRTRLVAVREHRARHGHPARKRSATRPSRPGHQVGQRRTRLTASRAESKRIPRSRKLTTCAFMITNPDSSASPLSRCIPRPWTTTSPPSAPGSPA